MPASNYLRTEIGSARIFPQGPVVAGEYTSLELIYEAGFFGIDDTGSLKVVCRYASDMGRIQFTHPSQPNYVTVRASNGALLSCNYDLKNNIRPWGKTLYIKVVKGYLKKGDKIIIKYGDTSQGSPGIRMQTFCEDTFEFKVFADVFATCDYAEIQESPSIKIVPGEPVSWKAVIPTHRKSGQKFRLGLKSEDRWGNPSDKNNKTVYLKANVPVSALPDKVVIKPGQRSVILENLAVNNEADLKIGVYNSSGNLLTSSNPCRINQECELLPFWADMHGQSEETIGSNTAEDYFLFARDLSFLDAACHQGNDFQITKKFWSDLNRITGKFDTPGEFVTFPGYEWSGNTELGGDHNVIFRKEGEQIHRSSHALVEDLSDSDTDRHTTRELFETLKKREVFVYAHVGGRFADLKVASKSGMQVAVEIHSAWGTFEWLLQDAFKLGLKPGIVANSDGHKGRPGASYPGASLFGSFGGLTCFLCRDLSRDSIFESLKSRHHFATTGTRMVFDVRTKLPENSDEIIMGDIIETGVSDIEMDIKTLCPSPVERIDIFNGPDLVGSHKACPVLNPGRRLKIIWEGAEYRGRGRETGWNGNLILTGNSFVSIKPVNFWNPEKPLFLKDRNRVSWESITTGGFSGLDILLEEPAGGSIAIDTPLFKKKIEISRKGFDDTIFECGGLGRRVRIYSISEKNENFAVQLKKMIRLNKNMNNPVWVRITLEDGHMAWSSPVYFIHKEKRD